MGGSLSFAGFAGEGWGFTTPDQRGPERFCDARETGIPGRALAGLSFKTRKFDLRLELLDLGHVIEDSVLLSLRKLQRPVLLAT